MIEFLSGKTEPKKRKEILKNLEIGNINLLIGTHSLFQEKINYSSMSSIIVFFLLFLRIAQNFYYLFMVVCEEISGT